MKVVEAPASVRLRNILFATDFSPSASLGAPYVAELARHYRAGVCAFHVRPPTANPMMPPYSWRGLEEAARVEANQQKQQLLAAFPGIRPEVLIREGDLWSNLRAAIEENNIDLIVIGTRGRSGIRKLLLGSAAEEIFRKASCPVLTVGPYSPSHTKSGEFTQILFASDFSAESLAALPYALSFAKECQAYLTLLHLVADMKAGDLVHPSEVVPSATRLLRDLVPPDAELLCVPDYVVECGTPSERILRVAAGRKADLIVLGVRQPRGLPGAATHLPIATARRVVSQAHCPVLTVRG